MDRQTAFKIFMALLVTFYFISFLFSGMSALQAEVEKLKKSAVKGQLSVESMIFILCSRVL